MSNDPEKLALHARVHELEALLAVGADGRREMWWSEHLLAERVRRERDELRWRLDELRAALFAHPSRTHVGYLSTEDALATLRKRVEDQIVELQYLRAKAAKATKQVAVMNDELRKKNVALDAMHWVWCDGGCAGGAHRFAPGEVTREVVDAAVRNTKRLVTWWRNATCRAGAEPPADAPTAADVEGS